MYIEACPFEKFTIEKQGSILRRISKLENALNLTQNVFSLPSFLISISYFCTCITLLAVILFIKMEVSSYMHFEFVSLLFNSSCGLVAIIWEVGNVPIEAENFKKAFRRKFHQKLLCENKVGEVLIETHPIDTSDFVLSGCNIIHFHRNSILALAGTILTYTVLLLSKN
ncbi:uncharacterized protein NPIL_550761 [Nephila pilipes]|uniref:Gustatory receptor n=1 Tax=Nephila pilipes TaxID=299642 RepID=A0A8X6NKI9_NEPPI|nr:uncharacterized protein NPIL_385991 [Nephila pilipes]GFU35282.1 uncharacterized protein NPIL_550761 [Nephila pilipes]